MGKAFKQGLCALAVLLGMSGSAWAQALGTSSAQLKPGSWKALVYYQGVRDQALGFAMTGSGVCIASAASSVSFPCGSTGETKAEGSGGAVLLKLIFQPHEGFQYYLSAGAGDYSLRVASVSVVNSLTGDRPGFLYGAGVKAVLMADTLTAPGVALDANLSWQRYYFNELQPGRTAAQTQIDQRLDLMQTQVAVEAGHLFKPLGWSVGVEPYGGLKWVRSQAWLKDLGGGGRVGGMKDAVTPFLGVELPIYEKEGLFAEVSFLGGIQYAAGLNIRFK
ncbi:MAG: hypothetical protein AAB412_02035 [Elusimicrobiota bacterium]